MSKINDKAMNLFQAAAQHSEFPQAFEEREASKSTDLITRFSLTELTKDEDIEIQKILFDGFAANTASEEQVTRDHKSLATIISQIRAIECQNVLLHGERIRKAQEILKPYKDGAFTRWLKLAYGNRQTPYRILQYFEFFNSLTGEVKQLMQSMPKKAAYVLASRDGNQERKIEIIKEHHNDKPDNIIRIVQETFPLEDGDRRRLKANDTVLIDKVRTQLKKLQKRKRDLSGSSIMRISELKAIISDILAGYSESECAVIHDNKPNAIVGDFSSDLDVVSVNPS